MAPTIDSAGAATAITLSGTTQTIAHTTAGADRLIVLRVGAWANAAGDVVTGVTYNTVALTKVADSGRSSAGDYGQIWRLIAPATGAHNLVITYGSSGNRAGTVQITSYNGVDGTTPNGTAATATGSSTTPSANVTAAVNDLVIDAVGWDGSTATASVGGGQTSDFNAVNNGEGGAGSREAGAATVTMSWTLSPSSTWGLAGIALKPVAGGTTYTDTGGATSVFTGSGADVATLIDTGLGELTGVGSGADAATLVDTATAISVFTGSGADAATLVDIGTAISAFTGSGADAPIFTDTGAGEIGATGSGAETAVLSDTGNATSILIGSGADAPEYADTGTGVLTAIGSGDDARIYLDAGGALSEATGSGADAAILVDTGTGVLIAVGSGTDQPTQHLDPGHIETLVTRPRDFAPGMQRVWVIPTRQRTYSEAAA